MSDNMDVVNADELEGQMEKMSDIYEFIKDEIVKTDDSILTIIGRKFHDEDILSNYLAYVLDSERNGVGYEPLQNFLQLLEIPVTLSEKDQVIIEREYHLPNNRRIDLLITINEEILIAIEHKVFSGEHGKQTISYEKALCKLFPQLEDEMVFVYLTPTGKEPLNPNFSPVSYEQLLTALKEVNIDFTSDIRKAILFHEFIYHLEVYFMNNNQIVLSNKTLLYLKNKDMIQDLENQFLQDYSNVFRHIESVIMNYFSRDIDGEWEFDFREKRTYHQIYKPHWKTKELDIHFELILNQNEFKSEQLHFLLDIEGSEKANFKANHETRLKDQLTSIMDEYSILYRQGKRADTFARKTYNLLKPYIISDKFHFEQLLIEMVEEFIGFIEIIDQEIRLYSQNKTS